MTLEEKLRAYAAKGELVHLSVAFSNGAFHCNFAAASPAGGYAAATDPDPIRAIEKALEASPARRARVSKPKDEITAPVIEAARINDEGLPSDWTTP